MHPADDPVPSGSTGPEAGLHQWWPGGGPERSTTVAVAEPSSALDVAVGALPPPRVPHDRRGSGPGAPRHATRRRGRSAIPRPNPGPGRDHAPQPDAGPPPAAAPAAPAPATALPAPPARPALPAPPAPEPPVALPAPRPDGSPAYEPLAAVVLHLLADVTSTQALLGAIVDVALARVPRCDEASIALTREGRLLHVAASGDAVRRITEAQYQQGLGPCPAATSSARATVVEDVGTIPPDEAWAGIAEGYGVRALLAIPLRLADGLAGTLSVHTRSGPGVAPETTVAAQSLAGYAAEALTIAHRLETGT
jgi:hypothetical protein